MLSSYRAQHEGRYRDTYSLDLPVEITQDILLWLSKDDLLRICMVSHAFRDQATRLLFYDVELHKSQSKQVSLWCQLITNRVHLAQTVKHLSLPLILGDNLGDLEHDPMVDEVRSMLYPALRALSNLKSLAIMERSRIHADRRSMMGIHIDADLFLGCSFRLKSFRYGGFALWRIVFDQYWTSAALATFLCEQDQIQEWQTGLDINIDPAEDTGNEALLANLSIVSTTIGTPLILNLRTRRVLRVIASRKIAQIRLDVVQDSMYSSTWQYMTDAMSMLAPCVQSLSHFHLHFERPEIGSSPLQATHTAILGKIAQAFPKLKVFRYSPDLSSDVCFTALIVYAMLISSLRPAKILRFGQFFCTQFPNSNTSKH
ncbi:hypothetical protein FIBSPDRAFT_91022 [Athelia psychrophila]|uniref:F-box domain-containing protein n=1 Tax=Athelia psychrophila TaxID=1759441 RepID=A0A166DWQ6_9AGAM|nr:hypothetical protein FIBSPDRAFT_91022 [Fibularhizoctonia sp. CBS 109695]